MFSIQCLIPTFINEKDRPMLAEHNLSHMHTSIHSYTVTNVTRRGRHRTVKQLGKEDMMERVR